MLRLPAPSTFEFFLRAEDVLEKRAHEVSEVIGVVTHGIALGVRRPLEKISYNPSDQMQHGRRPETSGG